MHDGAAVLLRNGQLICALEEERLNRVKHSNFFPAYAIFNCLKIAGLSLAEVDVIAMNFEERTRHIFAWDTGLPSVNHFLEDPAQRSFSVRDMICELFDREFSTDVSEKLFFCNHHEAHLWSVFGTSGFSDALVVSIDGGGDTLGGIIAVGEPEGITILRRDPDENAIGYLYSDSIRILGYRTFDEYKAMGLAPYGDSTRFNRLFEKFYRLLPDGDYELLPREEQWGILYDAGLVKQARRAGKPFEQVHKDFAAALQKTTETILFHIMTHFRKATGKTNLCYSGGVAHNCTFNGKLLYSGLFDKIYIQPASHDAGGALGAAIAAYEMKGDRACRRQMQQVFLGRDIGKETEVRAALEAWGEALAWRLVKNPAVEAARLLADGNVLGWVQGRSEFGPRALGNRSIIADPRPAENWQRINKIVKNRESYRPFAPSVIEDKLPMLVDMPKCEADLSFMTYTLPIRENFRKILGAVTHVDGSARVQTVSQDRNPLYWELLREFFAITGVPAVLNTSFNNNVEPIVDTINDAVTCFLTTGLNFLMVGNYLVSKGDFISDPRGILSLKVKLPTNKKLVNRSTMVVGNGRRSCFAIESTASPNLEIPFADISQELYEALAISEEDHTVEELILDRKKGNGSYNKELLEELIHLWKLRFIRIQP